MFQRVLFGLVAAAAVEPAPGHAEWTATVLHPAGSPYSQANAAVPGHQIGFATIGGIDRALIWSGSPEGWVDLTPPGSNGTWGYAMTETRQGGAVRFAPNPGRAAIWEGTPESYIDLNPVGAVGSVVYDMTESQQGGIVNRGATHAALWSDSPESFVDLHPPGADQSWVQAIADGVQAGFVQKGVFRAALWRGTAGSHVDLTPPGVTTSRALDTTAEQQVGGADNHAAMWSGTAESFVDLHPPKNAINSEAKAICGDYQAGWVLWTDPVVVAGATIWKGTPESAVNLHPFLPEGYSSSEALGISLGDEMLYVVGRARNDQQARWEAVLWKMPLPADCPADVDGNGIVGFPDLVAVLAAWGNEGGPEDINGDGFVGMQDVIALLAAWGPCE